MVKLQSPTETVRIGETSIRIPVVVERPARQCPPLRVAERSRWRRMKEIVSATSPGDVQRTTASGIASSNRALNGFGARIVIAHRRQPVRRRSPARARAVAVSRRIHSPLASPVRPRHPLSPTGRTRGSLTSVHSEGVECEDRERIDPERVSNRLWHAHRSCISGRLSLRPDPPPDGGIRPCTPRPPPLGAPLDEGHAPPRAGARADTVLNLELGHHSGEHLREVPRPWGEPSRVLLSHRFSLLRFDFHRVRRGRAARIIAMAASGWMPEAPHTPNATGAASPRPRTQPKGRPRTKPNLSICAGRGMARNGNQTASVREVYRRTSCRR
jgi:hypothetical protein